MLGDVCTVEMREARNKNIRCGGSDGKIGNDSDRRRRLDLRIEKCFISLTG